MNPIRGLAPFDKLRFWLTILIAAVWTLSIFVDAIPHSDWDPPATIHILMMLACGGLFATLPKNKENK